MPNHEDEDSDPVGCSGPATVLTCLPRTIRRHELRLIIPFADSTIYEMEKRGELPSSADRHIWPDARSLLMALTSVSGKSGR